MKKIYFYALVISIFSSCVKIVSLDITPINAIHIKDINLIDTDLTVGNTLNYYYSKNTLYISDNLHKKIFALNSYNRIIFELGNIYDTSTQKQNQSGAWENILEEMQSEFNTSKQTNNTKDNSSTNSKVITDVNIREPYPFEDIRQIAVDNDRNLYVSHFFTDKITQAKKMEILKFSYSGQFLYRIGEEGRDNPAFKADISIQNFYFDLDNGVWIKYLQDGKQFLRYYSSFGKNILFYSEESIIPVIEGFLDQDDGKKKYTIEDIYPINNSRDIIVILDIYEENSGQLEIQKKQILTLNKQYILQDVVPIKNLNMQIYGMTNNNELYGLTYQSKEGYLLETYNVNGKNLMKSKFNPDINYYTRLNLGVKPDGGLLGVFLKSKDLVFMIWR